jgi:hypothetical protein
MYVFENNIPRILYLEDGNSYARLRTMSHTIQVMLPNLSRIKIIHQHVHLRRESQSHAPAHVLMRLYQIVRLYTKRKKDIMLECYPAMTTLI